MAVNSVLGEQCGSVAKIVKGTNAEFANLPQFLQSSHSPTAMLRILFKKMAFHHCEPCDSKAWQSAAQQVSLENKGHRSALADVSLENHRKILESYATCLKAQILPPTYFCIKHFLTLLQLLESCAACLKPPESSFPSLRGVAEAIHKNADSSVQMDCHATASAVSRNDRKNAQNPQSHILQTPQNKQAEVVFDSDSQAAGFADDFVGCRAQSAIRQKRNNSKRAAKGF